jgi:hypothetical protein
MRTWIFAAALLLYACAAQPVVVGLFATQLSASDVSEIKHLIVADRNASRPQITISAVARDRVRVSVAGLRTFEGAPQARGQTRDTFTAVKCGGTWNAEGAVQVKRMQPGH